MFASYEEDLHPEVKRLTMAEQKWLARLEKVLLACPTTRLALVTIGDSDLSVIDETVMLRHDIEIHDGGAERSGILLATIDSFPKIHGVSG